MQIKHVRPASYLSLFNLQKNASLGAIAHRFIKPVYFTHRRRMPEYNVLGEISSALSYLPARARTFHSVIKVKDVNLPAALFNLRTTSLPRWTGAAFKLLSYARCGNFSVLKLPRNLFEVRIEPNFESVSFAEVAINREKWNVCLAKDIVAHKLIHGATERFQYFLRQFLCAFLAKGRGRLICEANINKSVSDRKPSRSFCLVYAGNVPRDT